MNIFFVDMDPTKAAQQLHDKHVNKMLIESCQLLSTCRFFLGDKRAIFCKPTHVNHPSNVWVRSSLTNYLWLLRHLKALCEEYGRRFFRTHFYERMLPLFAEDTPTVLEDHGLTKIPLAMPDQYKSDDPVVSYRAYYIGEKINGKFWTNRSKQELDDWLASQLSDDQFKPSRYTKWRN